MRPGGRRNQCNLAEARPTPRQTYGACARYRFYLQTDPDPKVTLESYVAAGLGGRGFSAVCTALNKPVATLSYYITGSTGGRA